MLTKKFESKFQRELRESPRMSYQVGSPIGNGRHMSDTDESI